MPHNCACLNEDEVTKCCLFRNKTLKKCQQRFDSYKRCAENSFMNRKVLIFFQQFLIRHALTQRKENTMCKKKEV